MTRFTSPLLDDSIDRLRELAVALSSKSSTAEVVECFILGVTDDEATVIFNRGLVVRKRAKTEARNVRKHARHAIASLPTEKLKSIFGIPASVDVDD